MVNGKTEISQQFLLSTKFPAADKLLLTIFVQTTLSANVSYQIGNDASLYPFHFEQCQFSQNVVRHTIVYLWSKACMCVSLADDCAISVGYYMYLLHFARRWQILT